jgi:hypothetical protein
MVFISVWFVIPFFWDATVPLGHQQSKDHYTPEDEATMFLGNIVNQLPCDAV